MAQSLSGIQSGQKTPVLSATINAATQANPCQITTTAAHGLSNGDLFYISGVTGMTELNGNQYRAANVASTTIELTDPNTDANINSSAYTAYSAGGTIDDIDHILDSTNPASTDGGWYSLDVTLDGMQLGDVFHVFVQKRIRSGDSVFECEDAFLANVQSLRNPPVFGPYKMPFGGRFFVGQWAGSARQFEWSFNRDNVNA